MRRFIVVVGVALAISTTHLAGIAAAQDEPVCGPPGGEVPATIVDSGLIIGTHADDRW